MGNSEVGHLTIGSGRILFQDLMRVNTSIEDGSFFENEALVGAFARARERGGDVHLLGLVSRGGVHSHLEHLQALLELARREGMAERTWIHAFTDGRDVSPDERRRPIWPSFQPTASRPSAAATTRWTATSAGIARELARRRDPRRSGREAASAVAAVRESYERGVTDEFIEPVVIAGRPAAATRRGTPRSSSTSAPTAAGSCRDGWSTRGVDLTTMTRYSDELDVPVAFPEQEVRDTLAEVLSGHGIRQLHVAETEKYAHVTYFFNGGEEAEWAGETRILVPSPRDVPSYDHKPEMSAAAVTDRFCAEIGNGLRLRRDQLRQPGHGRAYGLDTRRGRSGGDDRPCLGRVVEATARGGGVCLITADHGNAERMLEATASARTLRTPPTRCRSSSPAIDARRLRDGGELSDLSPTVLDLLGIERPAAMTGRSLLSRS